MTFRGGSRLSIPLLLSAWSMAMVTLASSPTWLAAIYVGFSTVVGLRFLLTKRIEDGRASYPLYNVSFSPINLWSEIILTFAYQMWLSWTIVQISLCTTRDA